MTAPTSTPAPRLAPGELRRKVAAYLAAHPNDAHTAAHVASVLDRSNGAVKNALETLADQGYATRDGGSPVTYRATPTAEQAAHPPIGQGAAQSKSVVAALKATPPPPAANAPVARPNGTEYYPRGLAGTSDVRALQRLREAGVPVLLYGPPGTGKTSLVEAAFGDLITVAGDGDTAVADFLGEYVQTPDGRYEFVHGPLIRAMREGRALFIDDATLISPKVLAVVYPAMDGRREVVIKAHKGEVITAAPGFYVIAGHNPGVHGAILTEALASRFTMQVRVSTDYDLATRMKINAKAIKVARNLTTKQAAGEIGWAPQLRELLGFAKIEGLLGEETAVANLVGIAPEEDREAVSEVVQTVFGRDYEPLAIGKQLK